MISRVRASLPSLAIYPRNYSIWNLTRAINREFVSEPVFSILLAAALLGE